VNFSVLAETIDSLGARIVQQTPPPSRPPSTRRPPLHPGYCSRKACWRRPASRCR
jgi:hypothetical protein